MLALPQAVSPVTEDIFIFFLTTLYSVLRTVLTHDTQLFVVKVMNYKFFVCGIGKCQIHGNREKNGSYQGLGCKASDIQNKVILEI